MRSRIALVTTLVTALVALATAGCNGSVRVSGGAEPLVGTYVMVEENGQPLPSDPSAPYGCCITLSGTLTFSVSDYELRTSHRNKVNEMLFDNSERGTWVRDGRTITFTRTSGGGAGYPYLLAPGRLSVDGKTVTLLYGDEGPGSNQIQGVFRKNGV